ncbi:MAG: serine/threonine protein kinase [bacterium]|nr:serine/threonine protein kinase [bacterium]
MEAERWQRVDRVFAEALERGVEERPGFLDAACGEDRELRVEVEALLDADKASDEFLETPPLVELASSPGSGAVDASGPRSDLGRGGAIGHYRIEREIGRGGMAIVYLATRADQAFDRRVAIKLVDPGLMSEGLVKRFQSERQILAGLDHPHIARLLDGGATGDGRPYLVMEYIDGIPVDEYCDRHRLSVRRRLELFRRVCSAVHYAHQHLVVHRDIKPSNILVTEEGAPHLLDFGIAKLLDPEAFPITVEATATGLRPMTPLYASPEQVCGEKISTASDVYSLGVLLYKLLAGRLPHDLEGKPRREIERILSEEEPPRPSEVVAPDEARELEAELTEVAERRGLRPWNLRRRLAGDLDNIVLMALRKEPHRRYFSAEQLSQDLRRHLENLPVVARQDTFGYLMGSFVRRHKLWIGVAATVFVLIVAFALAMARQATQIARQRDRAELERVRASEAQERAETVSHFLIDLIEETDPWGAGTETIIAQQLLDRGAAKIERELQGQPLVRASLLDAIGTVYGHLGFYDEAARHLETALGIRRQLLGEGHLDVAESLFNSAGLHLLQGHYPEAEELFAESLEIRREQLGPGDPEVAKVLREQSNLFRVQGRYAESEQVGRESLEIFEQALGPKHPEVSLTLRALAGAQARQGDNAEAERLLESALAIDEAFYGEFHWRTAANLANLGFLHSARADYPEAERLIRRSLGIFEEILSENHPQIADMLVILANTLRSQERYGEAEPLYRRALGTYELALAEDHFLTANCLYELGHVVALQGRLAEAEPLLQRSLSIRRKVLDDGHPFVGESLRGLADLRREQGRLQEAEALYLRAMEFWEEHPGNEGTAAIPGAYATLLRATGRDDEAARLMERVEAVRDREAAE